MLYNKTQWREALEKGASVYYFYSSDPFLARTAAEKTAARLEAHFTWDAVCQKLLALAQSAQN